MTPNSADSWRLVKEIDAQYSEFACRRCGRSAVGMTAPDNPCKWCEHQRRKPSHDRPNPRSITVSRISPQVPPGTMLPIPNPNPEVGWYLIAIELADNDGDDSRRWHWACARCGLLATNRYEDGGVPQSCVNGCATGGKVGRA